MGHEIMKTTKEPPAIDEGDLVLQEIWRIKDELSAARGHDVHRLFAQARERERRSGHPLANLSIQRRKV
jgi:hypothetical protein